MIIIGVATPQAIHTVDYKGSGSSDVPVQVGMAGWTGQLVHLLNEDI